MWIVVFVIQVPMMHIQYIGFTANHTLTWMIDETDGTIVVSALAVLAAVDPTAKKSVGTTMATGYIVFLFGG